jgi:4a-hydroxytetrahydrobiopterin dehydratase
MDLTSQKCVPCEGGTKPLTRKETEPYLENVKGWSVKDEGKKIEKKFKFKDFKDALSFVNKVGEIAEEEGHHPEIKLGYGKVEIELSTHAVGGLSVNDFILATKIDQINP